MCKLYQRNAIRSIVSLLAFGFSFDVEFLNSDQQLAFASVASEQCDTTVLPTQILELPISRLTCTMKLFDKMGNIHSLRGSVRNWKEKPIAVAFDLPVTSTSRRVAEDTLSEWNTPLLEATSLDRIRNLDVIVCNASFGEGELRNISLTLSDDLMSAILRRVEATFAQRDDFVFLTATQFTKFAGDVHRLYDVGNVDTYNMGEFEFSDALFDELVAKQLLTNYEHVNVSFVVSRLWQFGQVGCDALNDESANADGVCDKTEFVDDLNALFNAPSRNASRQVNEERLAQLKDAGKLSIDAVTNVATYLGIVNLGTALHRLAAPTDNRRLSAAELKRLLNAQGENDVRGTSIARKTIRSSRDR